MMLYAVSSRQTGVYIDAADIGIFDWKLSEGHEAIKVA